ncbi:MAG TPA: cysteine desulfurase-like protein [Gemmatimonadaceae bacterium]|nr:cysteine desulfurase-like protein [Gemmatimonadaceae bacterium]
MGEAPYLVTASSMSADGARTVDSIRGDFPALERREQGHPVAYFDGPGGSQVPRAVVDAITDYLYHHNANTHWSYPTSVETDVLLAAARVTYADFFNAAAADVSFGNNTTTIAFHLARALARGWREGDEIIVTELDHHANIAPWRAAAQDRGLVVRSVPLDVSTFRTDWAELARALTPRTRLVAIGAASNALGTVTDVARACAMAHEAGALTFVDAVHLAPHAALDVRAIGCDFLACSSYKFYGPHAGVLFGRSALVQSLDVPKLEPAPNEAPERLETGTQNHEGIVGAAAAVEWLASLATLPGTRRERLVRVMDALHARGDALVARLWNGLTSIEGVTLFGPEPGTPRTPTVAFTVRGHTTDAVARRLVADGIFVSNGHFYAQTVAERLGRGEEGFVRAGAACYTTVDEVDRLIDAVRAL